MEGLGDILCFMNPDHKCCYKPAGFLAGRACGKAGDGLIWPYCLRMSEPSRRLSLT